MGKNRTVVIAGYYGYGNLGDEAIRDALVGELTRSDLVAPVPIVTHPARESEVSRSDPIRIFATLRRSSALVFGGGGLLQNRTSTRSLFYYLSLILIARLARRPVFLLGQGIGPIRGKFARMATRFALSKVHYIGCRDRGSLHLLGTMNLKGVLDADLFFLFPPIDHLPTPVDETPRISFSLKDPGAAARGQLIERSVELIEELHTRTNALLTFLPFFPAQDCPLAEQITRGLSFPCRIFCPHSTAEAGEVIATSSLLISSRLHPLEFALRVGTPMIAVAEDPKVEHFVSEVKSLGGPRIPCSPFPSLEEVLLLLNYSPAAASLQEAYRCLHEQATEAFTRFLSELKAALGGRDG